MKNPFGSLLSSKQSRKETSQNQERNGCRTLGVLGGCEPDPQEGFGCEYFWGLLACEIMRVVPVLANSSRRQAEVLRPHLFFY